MKLTNLKQYIEPLENFSPTHKVLSGLRHFRKQRRRGRLGVCDEKAPVIVTPEPSSWPAKIKNVCALITCGHGLYLLNTLQVTKLVRGHFYGLTRWRDNYYVFQRHTRHGGSIYEFKLNNKVISHCKRLFSSLSGGVHQIDFIDDTLFVTDSYRNEIVVLDPNGRLLKRFYPLGKLSNGRESPNYAHLNSIYNLDDYVYILAHNETQKTGKQSNILVLHKDDLKLIDVIKSVGSCAHNIVVQDNLFLVCDSLGGSLRNHSDVVFKPLTFTRGLALNDDLVLLGGSMYSQREARLENDVFIYFLDRRFELIGALTIKDAGQVHEIRLLRNGYELSNTS